MKEFFGILTLKGIVENQVKEKNFVSVTTAFSKIKSPYIKTDRLTIEDILKSDIDFYSPSFLYNQQHIMPFFSTH